MTLMTASCQVADQNCNSSWQHFLIMNSEISTQSQVNKYYQYLTNLKTELAVWRIAQQWICDLDTVQSFITWNSFIMLDDHTALCSMSATQFTSQQLKRTALELLNTSLIMISIQQQSQSIRVLNWFIRSVMTMFRKLSLHNQFSFMLKYDFKAPYIISSDDENDNYVLFTDSENNCDACNSQELEHKNHSWSSVKNWISHEQQFCCQLICHFSCCFIFSSSLSFSSSTNINSLLYDQRSLKSVWSWQRVIWVKDYVMNSSNINRRYFVIISFFDSHNHLIIMIQNQSFDIFRINWIDQNIIAQWFTAVRFSSYILSLSIQAAQMQIKIELKKYVAKLVMIIDKNDSK